MLTTSTSSNLNSLSPTEAAFTGGVLGSVVIGAAIFAILVIIAEWKIFEKAGEKGWKSLIPIYGQYLLFKIVGAKIWFWVLLGVTVVASIMMAANPLPIDYSMSEAEINAVLDTLDWSKYVPFIIGAVATCLISFVTEIVLAVKLAKAFGKGAAYIIGLIFFAPIVLMVLGFGKAKYDKKAIKE